MWVKGKQLYLPQKNVHKELFEDTKGFLDEKQAKKWIYEYFRSNIYVAARELMGVSLFPFQEIMVKTMLNREYTLGILSRGSGKSYSSAVYIGLEAILNPNCKIGIISASFRQSRLLFQALEDISKKKGAALFAECIVGSPTHGADLWEIKFNNGSSVKALPLGSGEKLRGFRFNVLVIDELLLMSERILKEVIMPFLSTNTDVDKRVELIELFEEAIKKGIITSDEYETIKNTHPMFRKNKMIGLSSASYEFEYLYDIYKTYIQKIESGTDDGKPLMKDGSNELKGRYAVFQFSYDIVPKGLYDESLLEKSKTEMSGPQFRREFGSQFTDESSGFFNMATMDRCTAKPGAYPCCKIKGDKDEKYVLAIDPNASESDNADFFAMVLMRLDADGKYTQIHSYGVAGLKYSDHIRYLYYVLTNFNVVFISMDNAGGPAFLRACQESKLFIDNKIKIDLVEECKLVGVGQEYNSELIKFRDKYKPTLGKIVYLQHFSPDWIRQSNENLQHNIDVGKIKWASQTEMIDEAYDKALSQDIDIENIKFSGEEIKDYFGDSASDDYDKFDKDSKGRGKQVDFIQHQGFLTELTKRQIASIEPRVSETNGTMQFVLPKELKARKGKNRARRDLYTAVLIGSWAVKAYNDMQALPAPEAEDWEPMIL